MEKLLLLSGVCQYIFNEWKNYLTPYEVQAIIYTWLYTENPNPYFQLLDLRFPLNTRTADLTSIIWRPNEYGPNIYMLCLDSQHTLLENTYIHILYMCSIMSLNKIYCICNLYIRVNFINFHFEDCHWEQSLYSKTSFFLIISNSEKSLNNWKCSY